MTPAVIQGEGCEERQLLGSFKGVTLQPRACSNKSPGEVVKARPKQAIAMVNAVDCDPQHQWSLLVVRGFALLPSEASFLTPSVTDWHHSMLDLSDSLLW